MFAQMQVCMRHTHTYAGIHDLADRTIFKHSYPLNLICIILIKCLLRSTQSGCQVESRRKQILLYVNLLYYDIV